MASHTLVSISVAGIAGVEIGELVGLEEVLLKLKRVRQGVHGRGAGGSNQGEPRRIGFHQEGFSGQGVA